MRACVISIGDEVLAGQIINSNAAFLASRLTQVGFFVDLHLVVSDFDTDNKQRIDKLTYDHELIICCGGLGPTVDDMTRSLFADLLGCELVFNQQLADSIKERFGDHVYNTLQAMVPEKAQLLKNTTGQAAGLLANLNDSLVAALPGVPHEMKIMFEEELLPIIRANFHSVKQQYEHTVHFFGLYETTLDPYLKQLQSQFPHVSCGIYPAYGTLRVCFKGPNHSDVKACAHFLEKMFKSQVYVSKSGKLEDAVFEYLKEKNVKLALAESMTGGHVAAKLVSIPGVSSHFLGSCVVYSNEIKSEILGVHPSVIAKYGAVSEQTAELMLQGIFQKTHADAAIAITGIAGPSGGSQIKPVGLVYYAIGLRHQPPKIIKAQFKGDRAIIIETATNHALGYFLQYLNQMI